MNRRQWEKLYETIDDACTQVHSERELWIKLADMREAIITEIRERFPDLAQELEG